MIRMKNWSKSSKLSLSITLYCFRLELSAVYKYYENIVACPGAYRTACILRSNVDSAPNASSIDSGAHTVDMPN